MVSIHVWKYKTNFRSFLPFWCFLFFKLSLHVLLPIISVSSVWMMWKSDSSVLDVIVHLYHNTGEYKKKSNVKKRHSYVHTAKCWHIPRFDPCFQCVETSLLPACVCLWSARLLRAHIKMLWKSFKHLLRVAGELNHVAWIHSRIMQEQ